MTKQWKVLLIGGNSATGKSYLARQLADYFHTSLTEIDDIRIALQQNSSDQDLLFFIKNPNHITEYSPRELTNKLIQVGKSIWPALKALIEKHIACDEPIIFEGDGVIPELLTLLNASQVKSIFIFDEKENIRSRELLRQRGGNNENIKKQIDFSYDFGQTIKTQAEQLGLITISASPQETLFQRTIDTLEK